MKTWKPAETVELMYNVGMHEVIEAARSIFTARPYTAQERVTSALKSQNLIMLWAVMLYDSQETTVEDRRAFCLTLFAEHDWNKDEVAKNVCRWMRSRTWEGVLEAIVLTWSNTRGIKNDLLQLVKDAFDNRSEALIQQRDQALGELAQAKTDLAQVSGALADLRAQTTGLFCRKMACRMAENERVNLHHLLRELVEAQGTDKWNEVMQRVHDVVLTVKAVKEE